MRFEALDITIESRGPVVWVFLSGPFHREQVPNIREKLLGLIDDGNRRLVVDLEKVGEIDAAAPPMFLELLNLVRGKGGEMSLVFRNEALTEAFAPYRNIFAIHADARAMSQGPLPWLWEWLNQLSRRTGVRLSLPVALFMLFTIVALFASLVMFVRSQQEQIRQQEVEIRELTVWKQQTLFELNELKERLRPMEQLGILEGRSDQGTGK